MTGHELQSIVLAELRLARTRFRYELRKSFTGLHILLWSDYEVCRGIGNRIVVGHSDSVRRREASVGVLPLHSRSAKIIFGGRFEQTTKLHLRPRTDAAIVHVLLAWAIASVIPTPRRLRVARRRLRAAGVRLKDFKTPPTFSTKTVT